MIISFTRKRVSRYMTIIIDEICSRFRTHLSIPYFVSGISMDSSLCMAADFMTRHLSLGSNNISRLKLWFLLDGQYNE